MSKYVEQNLGRNENIVKKADLNGIALVGKWIFGILFFWLLFIPLIKAIAATVKFFNIELAITNKRVVGKVGVANTSALDAPLDKIQNASVNQKLFGKMFNYGTICIDTAAGKYIFPYVKNADAFKGTLMAQIDQAQEDKMQLQAEKMAAAMAGVINKN